MYISDFETWREEVESYWENEIDESSCDNKSSLKDDLYSYMDDLESLLNDYYDNSSQEATEAYLDALYSYVTFRYKVKSDEHQPSVPECIEDDDLRQLYKAWTYELTEDYDTIFSIGTDEETGECLLEEDEYSNIKTAFENFGDEDETEIENFRNSLPSKIKPTLIYVTYKKVDVKVEDLNVRCYVLQDMNLQEVLDTFNFEIVGVNVKTDGECS